MNGNNETPSPEFMNPLEQLAEMLAWSEDYTEEYKQRFLREAILYVMRRSA